MQPHQGQVIAGKYALEEMIGRGGMATVWKAYHEVLDVRVAIKLLTKDATDDQVIRFHREAQATARLRSPNVVHVSDCGLEDGRMFIVMELLEGEDLRERLQRRERLDVSSTFEIVQQITRALRKAHGAGIVHRDLKPGNIFLCHHDDLEVTKILDFGIARSATEHRITAPGTVLGTPAYMSPEQASGTGDVDHRADLWALGVLCYRMLTGAAPFPEKNGVETLRSLLRGGFMLPSRHNEGFAPLDSFFMRAFAPFIKDRFQDAAAFLSAFAVALEIEPAASAAAPRPAIAAEAAPGSPQESTGPTAPTLNAQAAEADKTGDTARSAPSRPNAGSQLLAAVRRLWTT